MAYLMLYPLRNINLLHINKDINMKNLQTIKQSVQKGFTLIELMIVVAIIGILAAIAIPAYTDYTIKSRIAEGASLVGGAKTAMEVYWSENGSVNAPDGTLITQFDLSLCDTAANCTVTTTAEYVSAIIIGGAVDAPFFEVHYKDSNALGVAADTCVNYYPNHPAGQNLQWEVRSLVEYDTASGNTAEVATCTGAATAMPNKYKPKV